jgi:hypothetical protein
MDETISIISGTGSFTELRLHMPIFNPTTIMNTLPEKLRSFVRESRLKLAKYFILRENCFLHPFTLEQELKREKKRLASSGVTV